MNQASGRTTQSLLPYGIAALILLSIPCLLAGYIGRRRADRQEILVAYNDLEKVKGLSETTELVSRKMTLDMEFLDDTLPQPRRIGREEILRELAQNGHSKLTLDIITWRDNIQFVEQGMNVAATKSSTLFAEHDPAREPNDEVDGILEDRWVRTSDGWKLQQIRLMRWPPEK